MAAVAFGVAMPDAGKRRRRKHFTASPADPLISWEEKGQHLNELRDRCIGLNASRALPDAVTSAQLAERHQQSAVAERQPRRGESSGSGELHVTSTVVEKAREIQLYGATPRGNRAWQGVGERRLQVLKQVLKEETKSQKRQPGPEPDGYVANCDDEENRLDNAEKRSRRTREQCDRAEPSRSSTVVEKWRSEEVAVASSGEETDCSRSEDGSRKVRLKSVKGRSPSPKVSSSGGESDSYSYYSTCEETAPTCEETPRHTPAPPPPIWERPKEPSLIPLPPPPSPPRQPDPSPPLEDRRKKGVRSYIHLVVEAEADLRAVSADLRNQAASVILATCANSKQAHKFDTYLSRQGFGTPTRGHGEQGRSPPEEYQEEYRVAVHGPIVIAGRRNIVNRIDRQVQWGPLSLGWFLIAQLDFKVSTDVTLHVRVAVIERKSTVVERGRKCCESELQFWQRAVKNSLARYVRVLVFKDSPKDFRLELQKETQYTHIANVCGPEPSFFVLGPVTKVQDNFGYHARMSLTTSDQTTYETKDWARISFMKVKACQPRLEKCTRTVVVLGSYKQRKKKARIRRRKNRIKKNRP